MLSKYIFLPFCIIVSLSCYSQKDTSNLVSKEALEEPSVKIGIVFSNLLDLYEGTTQQWNGFDDIDLYGGKGEYTNFDIGYGLLLEIPVNQHNEIDIELSTGKMTAQKENQYLQTEVSMLNIHYCTYLSRYKNPNTFNTRLFIQMGVGATSYKAERYFVKDNGLFSKSEGICLNNTASLGCMFTINNRLQFSLQTGTIFNYADGFDGYDSESVGDLMLKSSLGMHISL